MAKLLNSSVRQEIVQKRTDDYEVLFDNLTLDCVARVLDDPAIQDADESEIGMHEKKTTYEYELLGFEHSVHSGMKANIDFFKNSKGTGVFLPRGPRIISIGGGDRRPQSGTGVFHSIASIEVQKKTRGRMRKNMRKSVKTGGVSSGVEGKKMHSFETSPEICLPSEWPY